MTRELGPLARELSAPYYDDALPAHGRAHARRVHDLSLRLADDCDAAVDREVLAAAAWFHDVGRPLERSGEVDHHGEWGAAEAAELLAAESISADRIDAVGHCVRAHSIRPSSPEPATIEAKLLFDADKLEAAGAVGIARMACVVGERSGGADEKYASLGAPACADADRSDLQDVTLLRDWARERLDALYTSPARRLGESRWQFVEAFLERFEREAAGEE